MHRNWNLNQEEESHIYQTFSQSMADFSVTLAVEGPVKGTIGVSISLDDFWIFYFFHDQFKKI